MLLFWFNFFQKNNFANYKKINQNILYELFFLQDMHADALRPKNIFACYSLSF